jgi:hypothetical protein
MSSGTRYSPDPRRALVTLMCIAVAVDAAFWIILALALGLLPSVAVAILGTFAPIVSIAVGWVLGRKGPNDWFARRLNLIGDNLPGILWKAAAAWCVLLLLAGSLVVIDIFVNPEPVQPYRFAQVVPVGCAVDPRPWHWSVEGQTRCTKSQIFIRQNTDAFTEADLLDSYSQTSFRAQVHVLLTDLHDTHTYAGMVVQTPPQAHPCGGFLVQLRPTGEWRIDQVRQDCGFVLMASSHVTLHPGQPVEMVVTVQNQQLTASINGDSRSVPDPINADAPLKAVTGLMVFGVGTNASSEVAYSNLEIQSLPTYGLVVTPGLLALVLGVSLLALLAVLAYQVRAAWPGQEYPQNWHKWPG